MNSNRLQEFDTWISEEKFDCSIEEANELNPVDRLLVYLGQDSQNRERVLEIIEQEQQMGNIEASSPYSLIQFYVTLPFSLTSLTSSDVAHLLHFINGMMHLPGFEMNEIEDRLYYRYVLMTTSQSVDKKILLGIIGTILLFLDLFSDIIEQASTGKKTFNEILEELVAAEEKAQ